MKGDVITIDTILIVACILAAFLLGRMGGSGRSTFDGLLFLGDRPEDCHMMLSLSDEELSRCRTVMLQVVNEK